MNNILNSLFLENPYIPEQIYDFCNQLPDFRQAERDYLEATAVLRQRLGQEFDRFEEVLNWHLAQYSLLSLRIAPASRGTFRPGSSGVRKTKFSGKFSLPTFFFKRK